MKNIFNPATLAAIKKDMATNYNPTISVNEFRDKYLPLFLLPTKSGNNMLVWVNEVAKTRMNSVDIIDPATGTIILTVPPVLDSKNDINSNKRLSPIENATKSYTEMATIYPGDAKRILKKSLTEHIDVITNNNTEDLYKEAWIKILDYFEIPRINKKAIVDDNRDSGVFNVDEGEF